MQAWVAVLIVVIAAVLLGVVLYFIFRRRSNPEPAPPTPPPVPPTPPTPPATVWSDNITVGTMKLTAMIGEVRTRVTRVLTGYTTTDRDVVASALAIVLTPLLYTDGLADLTHARIGTNDIVALRPGSQTITYETTYFKSVYTISSAAITATRVQGTGTISGTDWTVLMTGTEDITSELISPQLTNSSGTDYVIFNDRVVGAYRTELPIATTITDAVNPAITVPSATRNKYKRITDVIMRSTALSFCASMSCIVTSNSNGLRPCQCVQLQRLSAAQSYPLSSVTATPALPGTAYYTISYNVQSRYGLASSTLTPITLRIGSSITNAQRIVNTALTYFVGWNNVQVGVNRYRTGPYWLALITADNLIVQGELFA